MKVIVTGCAGFIGSFVTERLLSRGDEVIGIDNVNDYYDVTLKEARLKRLHNAQPFELHRIDIADRSAIEKVFASSKPDRAVHLAAQAGVRYSIENPHAYIDANILGHEQIAHLEIQSPVTVEEVIDTNAQRVQRRVLRLDGDWIRSRQLERCRGHHVERAEVIVRRRGALPVIGRQR